MAAFAKNLLNWTAGRFAGSPAGAPGPLPTLLTAPAPDTQAQVDAAAARRRRMGLSSPAYNGTLLTGPAGVTSPATTQRATLLGGA